MRCRRRISRGIPGGILRKAFDKQFGMCEVLERIKPGIHCITGRRRPRSLVGTCSGGASRARETGGLRGRLTPGATRHEPSAMGHAPRIGARAPPRPSTTGPRVDPAGPSRMASQRSADCADSARTLSSQFREGVPLPRFHHPSIPRSPSIALSLRAI
jgi:hypothetical protein